MYLISQVGKALTAGVATVVAIVVVTPATAMASPRGIVDPSGTVLASAIDTRRVLGFESNEAYVLALAGSPLDVGTAEMGIPQTAAELAEVKRHSSSGGWFGLVGHALPIGVWRCSYSDKSP
jgi:hypothetical protein